MFASPVGTDRAQGPACTRPPEAIPGSDPRPAAVLCALFEGEHGLEVVLTRRSGNLRSHTGEVSFPGGRLEPGESAARAALREAEEEVGIDPATVRIVGTLTPLTTLSSGAAITPFVGLLPGRPRLRPNPAEVERAFTVSLRDLLAPGVHHEERWAVAGGALRPVHFFDLPGDTVWGATAGMLAELLDRLVAAADGPARTQPRQGR